MNNQTPIIKNRDIVVVSIQPWYYELGSNCKNIATYFSKNNRVLYVNIPITRKTFFSKKKSTGLVEHCHIIKKKGETIKAINKYMWQLFPTTLIESINWLPSSKMFSLINYLNNKRFANDIKKALKKLDFKDIILFNDNDIYNGYHLKKLISPSIYLYYCRDFLQGYSFWKKHASVLEPKLIKKADLVVTNSTYYAEYCSNYNRNSHYIGQGCNIELFDSNKKKGDSGSNETIFLSNNWVCRSTGLCKAGCKYHYNNCYGKPCLDNSAGRPRRRILFKKPATRL